ncbi:hypothetical protein [uncultured Cohaesibacter sp.]|uniref:hypothetical protein n=1 Tax=uncultured Cohaesibacter sp. TaxID=1002546 RepID=UPI00292F19FB|nr:hypothetical protein [uncultured Cohaesibacter sp.]
MRKLLFGSTSKVAICVSGTLILSACASGGVPTPPRTIGGTPPSIMESQPPAEDYTTTTTDQSENQSDPSPTEDERTDTLPPATSMPGETAPRAQEPAPQRTEETRAYLTFEPMVGAPKSVATELSKALGLRVAQKALPVVARSDTKVTHRIKGYFSASESGSDCVISYVWDIFDPKGKRVTRVTGSKKTAMISSDPWDSVKGDVLDEVAIDTAAKIKTWFSSL